MRNPKRLHFCRPCLHSLTHIGPETRKNGPYITRSQWTLERTIGILGGQIRQHSNPFANLAQRALRRCQINALKHMLPELDLDHDKLPREARDVGHGYALLRYADKTAYPVRDCEAAVIRDFARDVALQASPEWLDKPQIARWARLRLPNGQIARAWKEKEKSHFRMASNVKVNMIAAILSQ